MGRLRALIRWPWGRRKRWQIAGRVDAADEVPASIPDRRAILVGTKGEPKWLVFDCPCGDAHRLMLNLDPARPPRWTIIRQRPLSFRPSVDAHKGAHRCHFVMRSGRIHWTTNRTEQP
jgi:Family of unknown function (DUF6527)